MPHARVALRSAVIIIILLVPLFAAQAVEILQGPTLTMDPNGETPLAGVVEIETDVTVEVELTISGNGDMWTVGFPSTTVHYLPVLGLKPDRTYNVDIELIPGGPAGSLLATTGPLPADFPAFVTTVSNPAEMEPGYTLLDCMSRDRNDPRPQYSAIVDAAGDVVWYIRRCHSAAKQLPNGNILRRLSDGGNQVAREQDMLGNYTDVVLQNTGLGLHHDLFLTPHGTYLSIDQHSVDVAEFPTSTTDPDAPLAPTTLQDDSIVEFLPDGTVRREWLHTSQLDTLRVAYDSLNWQTSGYDWTHSNAVVYNLDDDSIVVSARHQDAVFKFSRETGELVWILGPHDNWSTEFQQYLLTPVGTPFRWQFHQHAPMWTAAGTLLLFDNGNWKASPFDGNTPVPNDENFSRGVEYEIDAVNMEVQQLWEYGENIPELIYSDFICDADWLETTGNRLTTFGGTKWVGGVSSEDLGLGTIHARIIETTDDIVPVKVFDLTVYDPAGGRISVYRSERIPSLYPQQYIKAPNGVGNSVMVDKVAGLPELSWTVSPVDSEHNPAGYYIIYVASSPSSGFAMTDSTTYTSGTPLSSGEIEFYKIVAANTAGKSADVPLP